MTAESMDLSRFKLGSGRARSDWDHTLVADERAEHLALKLPLPSLGRDNRIDKHTYVGSGREILLIDVENDSNLRAFIAKFEEKVQVRVARGESPRSFLLNLGYAFVDQQMVTNPELSQEIARRYADKPIPLGFFVDQGGVCRHKNLVLALMLERAKTKGWISGNVSIDRATDAKLDAAHAWVRYENSKGEIVILDTLLQRSPMALKDTIDNNPSEVKFDYRRPEDRNPLKKVISKALGYKWRS